MRSGIYQKKLAIYTIVGTTHMAGCKTPGETIGLRAVVMQGCMERLLQARGVVRVVSMQEYPQKSDRAPYLCAL